MGVSVAFKLGLGWHRHSVCSSTYRRVIKEVSKAVKSQISTKTSRGKKSSTKDTTKYTTSDSQANSHLPHRRPPASLTFNIYFYPFLYLYITRITINNGTPHLKSRKNQSLLRHSVAMLNDDCCLL